MATGNNNLLKEVDKIIADHEKEGIPTASRIGGQLVRERKEAVDTLLAVYTTLERICEKVGYKSFPTWCMTHTNIPLDEWYKQAVILPVSDAKRVRDKFKHAIKYIKDRSDREKRIAAAMDISEVEKENIIELAEKALDEGQPFDVDGVWEPSPKDRLTGLPKTTAQCEKLLLRAEEIWNNNLKKTRIQVGKIYFQLKELVDLKKVGMNPETDKPWVWTQWSELYIGRPERTIRDNIQMYLDSINNKK